MRSKKVFPLNKSFTIQTFGTVSNNSEKTPVTSSSSNIKDSSDLLKQFQFSKPLVAHLWSPVQKKELTSNNSESSKKPASIYKTARGFLDSRKFRVKIIPPSKEKLTFHKNVGLKSSSPHQTKEILCSLTDIISLMFFFILWNLYKLYEWRKGLKRILLSALILYILLISRDKLFKYQSFENSMSNSLLSFANQSLSSIKAYNKANFFPYSSEELSCTEKLISIIHTLCLVVSNIIFNSVNELNKKIYTIIFLIKDFLGQTSLSNKSELKLIAIEAVEEMFNEITEKFPSGKITHNTPSKKHQIQLTSEKICERKFEKSLTKVCNMTDMQLIDYSPKAIKKSNENQQKLKFGHLTPFEKSLLAILRKVFYESENKKGPSYFLNEWLNFKLLNKQEKINQNLKSEIETLKKNILRSQRDENLIRVERIIQKILLFSEMTPTFLKANNSPINIKIPHLKQKYLKDTALFSEYDETRLLDYALESAGGSILSSRCSESYSKDDYKINIFGFHVWTRQDRTNMDYISPSIVIQPSMLPGQCWAFKGSEGFLVIRLAHPIFPSGFTVEHIPAFLSPSAAIDSSPKDFSVWGLISENDHQGILLGSYSYDLEGLSSQYFPVQFKPSEPFQFVELKVHSNNGNPEYTCLYRFRVHGKKTFKLL